MSTANEMNSNEIVQMATPYGTCQIVLEYSDAGLQHLLSFEIYTISQISILHYLIIVAKVDENDAFVSNPVEQGSPESTSSTAPTLIPENSWKIIGSPARRASIAGTSFETPSPPLMQNYSEIEMMQKKSRATSVSTGMDSRYDL